MRDLVDILMGGDLQPVSESRHSGSKCMDCSSPPEVEVLWAEGMGHCWFCKKHFKIWSTQGDGKGDVCAVKAVQDGKVTKWGDNKSPNIMKSVMAEAVVSEQIPQHPEPEPSEEEQEDTTKWHKGGEEVDAVIPHEERLAFAGTEWEKATKTGIEVRQELWDRMNGMQPQTQHFWDSAHNQLLPTARLMQTHGKEGIWKYLEGNEDPKYGPLGEPSKCVLSVPGSCLQCRPSEACAQFCYAYKKTMGRGHYADIQAKAEVNDYAANMDPKRFADAILANWRRGKQTQTWGAVNLSMANKALRLFDRGDISEPWIEVVKYLNEGGLRTHIFSKRADLLKQIDDWNVRLLSTDNTNSDLARKYDLPVAYNFTGEDDLQELYELQDKIQLILPVKGVCTKEELAMIPKKPFSLLICPVDKKLIKYKEDYEATEEREGKVLKWGCPMCDSGTGLGCYHGQTTVKCAKAECPGKHWPKPKPKKKKKKQRKKKAKVEVETPKSEFDNYKSPAAQVNVESRKGNGL